MQLRKKNDVIVVPQQIQPAPHSRVKEIKDYYTNRGRQRFAVSEQFEKDFLKHKRAIQKV